MGVALHRGIQKEHFFFFFKSEHEPVVTRCSSTQTTQALIKETLAARKNVSPQNYYETNQLYAAGALRVACVGLQCIGFSDAVYHGVLEQSRYVQWSRSAGWSVSTATACHDTPNDDVKPAVN